MASSMRPNTIRVEDRLSIASDILGSLVSSVGALDDSDEEDSPPSPLPKKLPKVGSDNDNGDVEHFYSPMMPPPSRMDRSMSTSMRLSSQGFRELGQRKQQRTFAVKSIRHGSSEWHNMLRPFVADLAFSSLVQCRFQSEVSFRPYTCHAAALFVDLSHYSKITAAIADRGAHTLSGIVNAYLSRLLDVVRAHGGDVIKFAGDAVLVVWYGEESDLELNLLLAAQCVLEMQDTAGQHPVDGTSLSFRIHCGLSCGLLESEIFAAPNHEHMQRLYHSVGGDSLVEISELVEIAQGGEVCISDAVAKLLGERGRYRNVDGEENCKILTELVLEESLEAELHAHIVESVSARAAKRRKNNIEKDFIHPSVIRLLNHGGLSPTQISQMRNLCVLFIAMTSNGSSVNWLMEVQTVLDKNRCPIVQIIDDDKGVHLVAAVNLYESIPECSLLGLEVCRELVEKQVGCAVGMSAGSTFCGVTGSSKIACRWDITGPPPVRAARLMQYALEKELEVAIDQSVYDDPMAAPAMEILNRAISIKGTEGTIPVYTLSSSRNYAAFRVLETVHARVHDDVVNEIAEHLSQNRSRVAVVVTGVSLAGKKIVCQRAAGCANLVPYLHLSDETAGFLQLAKTIAIWFRYVDNEAVRCRANTVLDLMEKHHLSRAHDDCIELVDLALSKGLRACFLVDRVQFLDEFSLSLLRECLYGRKNGNRRGSRRSSVTSLKSDGSDPALRSEAGKVCFLCVHVPLYNWKSAPDVVNNIVRYQGSLHIPIIQLGEARREELRIMFRDLSDMEVEDRWLDAMSEASGNCAGYFIERAAAIRVLSGKLWSQGLPAYAETTEELVLHIPPGLILKNKRLPVTQVSAEVAMRFFQVFDELPPIFQTALKILTVATRTGFYKLPHYVLWEVLNDLIADGVENGVLQIVLSELNEMCLLKTELDGEEDVVSFQNPALADIAFDVSTPIQIHSMSEALIERLEGRLDSTFRVPLVIASLHQLLGHDAEVKQECWVRAYALFLQESSGWTESEINKWKESIDEEITASGCSARDILGEHFHVDNPPKNFVGKLLPLLKIYSAPISFGPMGHTLSVITRNTFHEFGLFHGTSSDDSAIELRKASTSASLRYLQEMEVVEAFLAEHGLPESEEVLQKERAMIQYLSKPAVNDKEVQIKAKTILDEFVPQYVNARLQRLYSLVNKLRADGIPIVLQKADAAIQRAYEALRAPKCPTDSAQDALVIMATMNWKPKPVPEYLPLLHYQTVARIRNKVLKRLSETELYIYKHQQTHLDLEVFLIVTALLAGS